MRWRGRRRSSNVEDRRGRRMAGRRAQPGGLLGVIVLVAASAYFGLDPRVVLNQLDSGGIPSAPGDHRPSAAEQELAEFVSVVLADTEDAWHALFGAQGSAYAEPTLVLFSDSVRSACGVAGAAVGPFYCPADGRIYIDLAFYRDLRERYGAPGDFAQAYVVAHEVGHHVQNLLGISGRVQQMRRRLDEVEGNRLSVRLELQADCLAGVWAHHADRAKGVLEAGDVDEALRAASAIGDDRLQRQAQGQVTPDSFTHGSSAQRRHWFGTGLEAGRLEACDTFAAATL